MLNFKAECIGVCVFREQNINRRMDLPCTVHSNGNGQKIFKLNNAKFYGWMHWSVCVSRAEHLQENGFTMCSTEQWKWWVKFLNWFFKVNFKTKLCNVCHLSYWKLFEMIQKCRPTFFGGIGSTREFCWQELKIINLYLNYFVRFPYQIL